MYKEFRKGSRFAVSGIEDEFIRRKICFAISSLFDKRFDRIDRQFEKIDIVCSSQYPHGQSGQQNRRT